MKKTYISPETLNIAISTQHLIMDSAKGGKVYDENAGSGEYGLSRTSNFSVWGDEEEEE